jgi:nickel-dependent lactate racemase
VPLKESISIRLPYGGNQEFSCELESQRVAVFRPGPGGMSEPAEAIRKTLASPTNLPCLDQALVSDDNVVIALDRHTPGSPELIAEVWHYLERRDIDPERVTILQPAGLGTSRPADPRTLLPESLQSAITWKIHDPTDEDSCAYLATTSGGDRIYLAKEVVKADFVLPIGTTAFDPLLGYRGTHSVVYPGLSTVDALARTVGQGHRELAPRDTRPLRQLVDEIAWLMGIQFVVQVVAASGEGFLDVAAGCCDSVFDRCRQTLDDHWMITMPERVDTVVVAIPQDASGHSWAQLGQALATARQLVEADGRIVILSEINEEPGDGLKVLCSCEDPLDALRPLRESRPADLFVASQLASAADWARLYVVSALDSNLVEDLFMFPLEGNDQVKRLLASSESCALIGAAQNTFGLVE